jgi:radical SAM protein with 4Fe4S-binding SPASM domain
MRPKEAFIAVTYSCNAKCQMCNIWKNPPTAILNAKEYAKLPSSLTTINITGGEPFLRTDLVEVVRTIDSILPRCRIVFSTNGMMTKTIVNMLKQIRTFHSRVGVGVSIDGVASTHDAIRGVPDIFNHAIATVRRLKEAGFNDLRIAMTLQESNVREVGQVFELSCDLGVEFTMTLAHDSDLYFKKSNNVTSELLDAVAEELPSVLLRQLKSKSAKDWFRAYHTKGIMDPELRRRLTSNCEAGRRYFFMSPEGDIYPCNVLSHKMGNLSSAGTWDDLFTDSAEEQVREVVRNCKKDCWMICNARSLIIAHPMKTAAWVAKNKIAAHVKSNTSPNRGG